MTRIVSAIIKAPRFCFKLTHAHRIASPANGKMTERVRAARARNNPEKKKFFELELFEALSRKNDDTRTSRKNMFSVARPIGKISNIG